MSKVFLSLPTFFRLAYATKVQIDIHRYGVNRLRCYLSVGDVNFYSSLVTLSYAKKWCPLIMGENYYRNSLFYIL